MRKWLLGGIIILAFLLRVIRLSDYPVGFTPDEASFGYDAYSILKTGKDQWGSGFPLVLESFGDFKSPLYALITIPFVWLFGLTKAVVRLPNALLGAGAVYVTYLLVNELVDYGLRARGSKKSTGNEAIVLIASLLLAISPWHVMMSRGAFEANLTTFFLPLGVLLLLRGLKKPKLLVWSSFVLGLNLFTYHSAKLVTPLVLLFFFFIFKREVRKVPSKKLLLPGLVLLISFTLTAYSFVLGAGTRAKDVSIFSGALSQAAEERTVAITQGLNPDLARMFHNKIEVSLRRFLANYSQYTSYQFLFTGGPAEATYGMIPGRGVLYWFELLFIVGFVYVLFKSKERRALLFILFWVLIAPIPAALTTGRGFAANRAVVMLPAAQILLAAGAVGLYELLKAKARRGFFKLAAFAYFLFSLVFFLSFLEDYFLLSPVKAGPGMLHGNLEAAQWLRQNHFDYTQVIISKRLSEPHIYIAFASEWNPADYQREAQDWSRYKEEKLLFVDQLGEYNLGKYTFRDIHYPADKNLSGVLLVGKYKDFPQEAIPLKTIYYPGGDPAVLIVDPATQVYAEAN